MTTHHPEEPQRSAQAHGHLTASMLSRPSQCCPQVIMLCLQLCQPDCLLCAAEVWFCLLRELQIVGSMSVACFLYLSGSLQALPSVLTDRLQHEQARLLP